MQDWISIVILGIIEGLTEFLPVSSTGHLLIAQQWLPRRTDTFNVVIQGGAVLAVLLIFHERVKKIIFGWHEPANRDFALKLAAAFLVTALGGLILKVVDFKLPPHARPVAWATLIGGLLIFVIEGWAKNKKLHSEVSWGVAIMAGAAQLVAAIFPGTSRSGITILTALVLGVNRPVATEFSFLLGIPTLLAAGGLELFSEIRTPSPDLEPWHVLALGALVGAVTAFIAVKWLIRFVQSHTFVGFGWYRVGLGVLILLLVS